MKKFNKWLAGLTGGKKDSFMLVQGKKSTICGFFSVDLSSSFFIFIMLLLFLKVDNIPH